MDSLLIKLMFTLTLANVGAMARFLWILFGYEKRLLRIEAHIKSELGGGATKGNLVRAMDQLVGKVDVLTKAMLGTDKDSGVFERLRALEQK